jgi:HAD superfamily hydrolase (TIGR01509 family)
VAATHFQPDPRPKALIFDFDGLILDTEMPVFESWRDLFADHGHELALEEFAACVGSTYAQYDPAQELERRVGRALDWESINPARRKKARARVHENPVLPGVVELLMAAAESGIPCAVASSSPVEWVEPLLEHLGIRLHFKAVRCLDHVSNAKPAPDLFLAAAEAVGCHPSESLALEDSLNGLTAATGAGMPCVIVPNAITGHLEFEGAIAVLESLAHLRL